MEMEIDLVKKKVEEWMRSNQFGPFFSLIELVLLPNEERIDFIGLQARWGDLDAKARRDTHSPDEISRNMNKLREDVLRWFYHLLAEQKLAITPVLMVRLNELAAAKAPEIHAHEPRAVMDGLIQHRGTGDIVIGQKIVNQ
jgi:hypothetical protein